MDRKRLVISVDRDNTQQTLALTGRDGFIAALFGFSIDFFCFSSALGAESLELVPDIGIARETGLLGRLIDLVVKIIDEFGENRAITQFVRTPAQRLEIIREIVSTVFAG